MELSSCHPGIALSVRVEIDDPAAFRLTWRGCVCKADYDSQVTLYLIPAGPGAPAPWPPDGTLLSFSLVKHGGSLAHLHSAVIGYRRAETDSWESRSTQYDENPDFLVGETYEAEAGIRDGHLFWHLHAASEAGRAYAPSLSFPLEGADSLEPGVYLLFLSSRPQKKRLVYELEDLRIDGGRALPSTSAADEALQSARRQFCRTLSPAGYVALADADLSPADRLAMKIGELRAALPGAGRDELAKDAFDAINDPKLHPEYARGQWQDCDLLLRTWTGHLIQAQRFDAVRGLAREAKEADLRRDSYRREFLDCLIRTLEPESE